MSQIVIGIGGAHSGSGKTHVARELIRALSSQNGGGRSVGAIKCTMSGLYTSITDEPEVIAEPGKDTALLKEAGASEVIWIQATPETVSEAAATAASRLGGHDVLVLEGNSLIEVLGPDIVIFISALPELTKQSGMRVQAMADVVIHGDTLPDEVPGNASKFSRDDAGAYVRHVLSLL